MTWWTWENPVAIWWLFLVCASIVNLTAWYFTKMTFYKDSKISDLTQPFQKPGAVIWLSLLYVLGCAFRSFLPRADVQRICLFDTWFSNVLIGRSVATIAEVAFILQWAVVLRMTSQRYKVPIAERISYLIVPMILFAEICSWYAVISTHYLGNSIEESTWGLSYILIGVALFYLSRQVDQTLRLAARIAMVGCLLYVSFMYTVDVPMYVSRLIEDHHNGRTYFNLFEGLHDLATRWVVTRDIKDWKTEIPWMSLYFSFAVLVSISLCYVPLRWRKGTK